MEKTLSWGAHGERAARSIRKSVKGLKSFFAAVAQADGL
jgi:hypothetical protein